MKTSIDFKDRMYQLLTVSGFSGNLAGKVITDTEQTVTDETVLVTSTGSDNGFEVVDNANVAINILLADINGRSNDLRFRYIIDQLFTVLEAYDDYRGDFNRYVKNNAGTVIAQPLTPSKEFFHYKVVSTDGISHDPERPGYSYFSVVIECWIEK